eukprot:GHVS01064339.1.p2 GENE.GHVS01064339.1~~GHVS01064339.1.p2  ORF type:complete len:156 (+),score=58.08 GHVS01064339.1:257-724(+)
MLPIFECRGSPVEPQPVYFPSAEPITISSPSSPSPPSPPSSPPSPLLPDFSNNPTYHISTDCCFFLNNNLPFLPHFCQPHLPQQSVLFTQFILSNLSHTTKTKLTTHQQQQSPVLNTNKSNLPHINNNNKISNLTTPTTPISCSQHECLLHRHQI